jgi:hypothetical protein
MKGITDNRSNEALVSKNMTTKFPSYLVLLELTEQLRTKGWAVELTWVPRDANQIADDLTNEVWDRFDDRLRVSRDLDSFEWLVLPKLYPLAAQLYQETAEAREKTRSDRNTSKRTGCTARTVMAKRQKSTRLSQPWDEPFVG